MFRRDRRPEESNNFWVSYADLMAGLLFVFILLIGAIVSKSILMRQDLKKKEATLEKTVRALEEREATLEAAKRELKEKERRLQRNREDLAKLEKELRQREEAILSGKGKIARQSKVIDRQKEHIAAAEEKIRLQEEEVRKLHLLLEDLKMQLNRERNVSIRYRRVSEDLNRTLAEREKSLRTL